MGVLSVLALPMQLPAVSGQRDIWSTEDCCAVFMNTRACSFKWSCFLLCGRFLTLIPLYSIVLIPEVSFYFWVGISEVTFLPLLYMGCCSLIYTSCACNITQALDSLQHNIPIINQPLSESFCTLAAITNLTNIVSNKFSLTYKQRCSTLTPIQIHLPFYWQ
jgi:hypothetical protein